MRLEPFNIIGKTIKDCFFIDDNKALRIEFTDGTCAVVAGFWISDADSLEEADELDKLVIKTEI